MTSFLCRIVIIGYQLHDFFILSSLDPHTNQSGQLETSEWQVLYYQSYELDRDFMYIEYETPVVMRSLAVMINSTDSLQLRNVAVYRTATEPGGSHW